MVVMILSVLHLHVNIECQETCRTLMDMMSPSGVYTRLIVISSSFCFDHLRKASLLPTDTDLQNENGDLVTSYKTN